VIMAEPVEGGGTTPKVESFRTANCQRECPELVETRSGPLPRRHVSRLLVYAVHGSNMRLVVPKTLTKHGSCPAWRDRRAS
jgi:hypothetical protein